MRHFYYLDGGAIYLIESGQPDRLLFTCTDNLGSIVKVVNKSGTPVFKATYDAWGYQSVTKNQIGFHRGYTGHEMLPDFCLINMNGRMYDPAIGRFLSPDNYIQLDGFSQSYNRYSYCLNNPLKYTDPDGESAILIGFIVGAVAGAYMGGVLANDSYNPLNWKSSSTWRYMLYGSLVGGISGAIGGSIAASGMPFANTTSLAFSSFFNSVGTSIYTNGQVPVSISLGIASYDLTNNEWGYFGKEDNTILENMGYGFGALANLTDVVTYFRGGSQNIKANSKRTDAGHEKYGHFSLTGQNGNTLVSVGPDTQFEKSSNLLQTWKNSIKAANTNWDTYLGQEGTWSIELNNISTNAINEYVSNIKRWDLLLNSCVGHASRALWAAGVPNIYLFHPHLLSIQLTVRQIGIYSSPFLITQRQSIE